MGVEVCNFIKFDLRPLQRSSRNKIYDDHSRAHGRPLELIVQHFIFNQAYFFFIYFTFDVLHLFFFTLCMCDALTKRLNKK